MFVAPANLESFGIAALEARCAGLPVLAKANSGIREFVSDEREGLLAADRRRAGQRTGPAAALARPARRHRRAQPHGPSRGDLGRRAAPHRGGVRPRGRGAQGPYPGPVSDVGWSFVKGHGTGNDFVVLPDPTGALELTPSMVAAICDRRTGDRRRRGAARRPHRTRPDGRAGLADDRTRPSGSWTTATPTAPSREMCGNGVRVFVTYLVAAGLAAAPGSLRVATRAGGRDVVVHEDAPSPCGWARRGPRSGPAGGAGRRRRPELAARRRRRHGQPARGRVRRGPGRAGTAAHRSAGPAAACVPGRGERRVRPHPGAWPRGHARARARRRRDAVVRHGGVRGLRGQPRRRVGPDAPAGGPWTCPVVGWCSRQPTTARWSCTGPAVLVAAGTLDAAWLDAIRP